MSGDRTTRAPGALPAGLALAASRGWPPRGAQVPLLSALAVGLGLGAAGWASFALLAAGFGPRARGFAEAGLLVAATVVAGALLAHRPRAGTGDRRPDAGALLAGALGLAALWAAASFVQLTRLWPHGGWDAWMTWNLRARFLYRGQEWEDAFTALLPWAHPDYPPLLPTLVARGWWYLGHETVVVPAAVGGLFALATLAALYGGVARLRGTRQACVAGLVLLSVPFFVRHAAAQYADVPLAFFVLAALILVTLDARGRQPGGALMALAGVAAGLAAWTKNEGMVFLVALVGVYVVLAERWDWARCARPVAVFALGALPLLALLAYFKLHVAPPNEVVAEQASRPRELWYYSSIGVGDQLRELGVRVLSADRHLVVAKVARARILEFGFNGLFGTAGLLVTYLICLGGRVSSGEGRAVLTAALALALTLGGYWVVLVTAPGDLPRLVNSSLDRLLLQLWPGLVFVYFLVAAPPGAGSDAEEAARVA